MKADFEQYYRQLFDSEADWQKFIKNLTAEHKPTLLFRRADEQIMQKLWAEQNFTWNILPEYSCALLWPEQIPLGTPLPGVAEKLIYPMNRSSLAPVIAMDVQPGERVLDACAAPGGKAIALYDELYDQPHGQGEFVANDVSRQRVQRLRTVLRDFRCDQAEVWCKQAETIFKKYPASFDKILLDAPCSSEKHVYTNTHYLQQWTPARIRHLRYRQIALINGLWLALKPTGRLVYATCAVNRAENEDVIADFLQRHPEARLLTEQRIWPDAKQHDPMYVAALSKISNAWRERAATCLP